MKDTKNGWKEKLDGMDCRAPLPDFASEAEALAEMEKLGPHAVARYKAVQAERKQAAPAA